MAFRDEARFYRIGGQELPSVTTVLSVIAKPALIAWAANQERRAFETALLDVLTRSGARDPEYVLGQLAEAVTGVKASEKEKQRAASIGTAAHAKIEWLTRQMMGEDPGPKPEIPDAAEWAVMAWEDWAKEVQFTPITTERTVYCLDCGYAGTMDFFGKVRGLLTLGDYKTGKAIYPESWLQNRAYRHALSRSEGLVAEQGLVLRLPKDPADPEFEAMVVPDIPLEDFLAALRLWQWQRRMAGKKTGQERQP